MKVFFHEGIYTSAAMLHQYMYLYQFLHVSNLTIISETSINFKNQLSSMKIFLNFYLDC